MGELVGLSGWGIPNRKDSLVKRIFSALGASVLVSLALVVASAVAGTGKGSQGTTVARAAITDSSGQAPTHNKIPGTASGTLVLSYSPCATNVSLSFSGLVLGSELWVNSTSSGWASLGAPSTTSSTVVTGVAATAVPETWTAYAFPAGVNPAIDGIGSALITSPPLSFTTCGLSITGAPNCGVHFWGNGLLPGSVIWFYSTLFNSFWTHETVDSSGSWSSLMNGGQSGPAETFAMFNLAAGYDPRIAGVDPNSPSFLSVSNWFATGGCTV